MKPDQIYRLLATTAKHWNVAPPGAFSLEYDMERPPYLTDDEIAAICEPLVMPAAQRKYLSGLGLLVKEKPNGRALIARSEFERVLGARRFADGEIARQGPNIAATRERWANRKNNGTQAQKR